MDGALALFAAVAAAVAVAAAATLGIWLWLSDGPVWLTDWSVTRRE